MRPLAAEALRQVSTCVRKQVRGTWHVAALCPLSWVLRQAENDLNEAISALSSAGRQEALQLAVMQRAQHSAPHVPQPDAVRRLEAMGFGADAARHALVTTHGDVAAAATKLAAEGGGGSVPFTAAAIAAAVSAAAASSSSSSSSAAPAPAPPVPEGFDTTERARIDESGLQHAVRASERAYESINLDVEAAAAGFFLAAIESRLKG